MKKLLSQLLAVVPISVLILFAMDGALLAQEVETPVAPETPEIELPFIDRDSDGINDLLQNGWGLRFAERYKKRQELWNQLLNVEVKRGEGGRTVDTNGDGVGDVPFHEFMQGKMNELIDTDGDGEKDTPLKGYLGGRFKFFDQDGDGLPDDLSADEIKERMQEMKNWKQGIRERVHQGESAFVDDDGDGIPDNLPQRFMKRGQMKEPMGGPMGGQK